MKLIEELERKEMLMLEQLKVTQRREIESIKELKDAMNEQLSDSNSRLLQLAEERS